MNFAYIHIMVHLQLASPSPSLCTHTRDYVHFLKFIWFCYVACPPPNFLHCSPAACLLLNNMSNKSKKLDGLNHHKALSSKLKTSIPRKKWRMGATCPCYKLTPAQKSQVQAKCKQRKQDINAALAAAREMVWSEAKKLQELFGRHTTKYYFEQTLQQGRISKRKHKINRWNVYYCKEVKRLNTGKYPVTYIFTFTYSIEQISPLGSTEKHLSLSPRLRISRVK